MGFLVENYSLDELHRISMPGAVVPSLFWALPVGDFHHRQLDDLWLWFTERQSECNDFGLLLVKDRKRSEGEAGNVSLASLGAKLSDLMPDGAERFITSSAYEGEVPRILILSGGYPQPGWGVLVEWEWAMMDRFVKMIKLTTEKLGCEQITDKLNVFKDAAQAFQRRQDLRTAPPKPNVAVMEAEILAAEKIDDFLREAQVALQAAEHRLVGEKVIAAMQVAGQTTWLNIPENALQSLLDTQRELLTADSVLAIAEDTFSEEVRPHLEPLLADPSKRQAAFRTLSSETAKHSLKACLHLRSKCIVEESGSFQDWAHQVLKDVPAPLEAGLVGLRSQVEAKLVTHRGSKAQREHEHQVCMDQWRKSSKEARDAYHIAVGKAAELQWTLGPQFLVAFEQICREQGLWVRSIPWDPARMVGWKLMASQVKLDSRDLQIAAQELVPDATGASTTNQTLNGIADGSYFTDYVHHIAISKPGFSPRAVTRDLLARLLRPAEMMTLIQAHTAAPPKAADASLLAEEVLHAFGWRQLDNARARTLAGCIKGGGDSAPTIAGNLSGNDLRIAAESFCKDVVDVVVSQLGYGHASVWSAIVERIPNYCPSSRTGDWDEEVRRMTLGSAKMILSALGPLAFSRQSEDVSKFVADLGKLTDVLNAACHDRDGEPVSSEWVSQAPALIEQLLAKAEAFLGDLPWHMEASFVYGQQPKVLSGEAWSHGSPTPRLLRVIVWTGASPGSNVTFWNKERRNPVVPDPVFITRPRKRP